MLLVGDRRNGDVAREVERRRLAARDQRGGEACLHVVRATPAQSIAVDAGHVRIGHPFDVHGIEMTAEEQRRPPP